MPEIKNTFLKGKMNKSLDDRILPEGEYRDALNVQVTKADGADVGVIHNIKGNTLKASVSGFSGTPEVIGNLFDDKNNRVFYFVTDNTTHKIYKWAPGDSVPTPIVSGTFLNFNKSNLIVGVNIIEDYLFWTDNRNQPRRISISKALGTNSFYDSEEKISVAKFSPYLAPSISMDYNANVSNNYIEDKFVRFSYRFKYEDDEYSQLAPFSQVAFKSQSNTLTSDEIEAAYKDGLLADFVNYINEVDITVDLPTNPYSDYQIRTVEFLMKDANSAAVRIIGKQEVNTDVSSTTYTYSSELPTSTLPEDQLIRVSENVPVKARAQEISGNRVIYGNYVQNYNLPEIPFSINVAEKSTSQNTEYPYHSIKQRRNYEVGIVLSDKYGRKSPVILSDSNIYVPAKDSNYDPDDYDAVAAGDQVWQGDTLKLTFGTLPSWGDWYSYRVVVKQTEQEYYNAFLPGVAKYNGKGYTTLLGDNINKIPRDDTSNAYNEMSTSSVRLYPKVLNKGIAYLDTPPYTITNGEISYKQYTVTNDSTSQELILTNYTSRRVQTLTGQSLQTSGTDKYYDLLEDSISSVLNVDFLSGYEKPTYVDVYVNGKLQYDGGGYTTGKYSYSSGSGTYGRITWTAENAPSNTDQIDVIVKFLYLKITTDSTASIDSLTVLSRAYGSTNYTIGSQAAANVALSVADDSPFSDNISIVGDYQDISNEGLVKVVSIGTLDNYTNLPKDDLPETDEAGFYKQSDSNLIAELNFTNGLTTLTQHVVDLAVFETEPFKSSLDIYYETSTSGLLSSLSNNDVVNVDYFNCFVLKGDTPSISKKRWHIEESRIRGDFNADSLDYGVQAHITNSDYKQETRANALIYSGIYNERTGVNNTNQFPSGQNITKALDIQNGSIQKLFAEDTNLTVFQEEKVSWIPIDKDIIYTAEGAPQVTSANVVLGQVVPYNGNYGIGKHPESFAYYAGRKYFVDQPKGAVLRLSRDGVTEISNYGMRAYFRDKLNGFVDTNKIIGLWDMYNQDYIVSIQGSVNETIAFDESANGWSSRYSFVPGFGGSLDSKFYTFKNGNIYEHYSNNTYNNFYGTQYNSEIDVIFNQNPSANKNFLSINYEGDNTWNISNIETDVDNAESIAEYSYSNDDLIISGFKKYDNKYFANIINSASSINENEVVLGSNMSGVKGHFMKLKTKTSATSYKELFSVSTNYNINSY